MKLRHFAVFGGIFTVIICLLLFLFIVTSDDEESGSSSLDFSGLNLSAEVLKHQSTVEKYAKEYRISDYVNYLLAIMQVESGGTGTTDVMQASESLGLPLNSLSVEDSIKQGCKYFSELLKSAEAKDCDINTVVQSYNYGGGFIDYVSKHGKKYTFELAVSFAKGKSGGVKVTYKNDILVIVPVGILLGANAQDYKSFTMTFIFYLLFVPAIAGILNKIMYISESFMQIDGNVARMDEIFNIPVLPQTTSPKKTQKDDVVFDNVSFTYCVLSRIK